MLRGLRIAAAADPLPCQSLGARVVHGSALRRKKSSTQRGYG